MHGLGRFVSQSSGVSFSVSMAEVVSRSVGSLFLMIREDGVGLSWERSCGEVAVGAPSPKLGWSPTLHCRYLTIRTIAQFFCVSHTFLGVSCLVT